MEKQLQEIMDFVLTRPDLNEAQRKLMASYLEESARSHDKLVFKLEKLQSVKKTLSIMLEESVQDLLKKSEALSGLNAHLTETLHQLQEKNSQIEIQKKQIESEQSKSEKLLLNILPAEIASELKQFGKSYARRYDLVSVLFADVKGFTNIAETMAPDELVEQLDEYFRGFDHIMVKHHLEKIKTIGDAYVAVAGLFKADSNHAAHAVHAALDMQDFIRSTNQSKKVLDLPAFEFRMGIHTGPIVAGVVGIKKFSYDIWGDAVNLAARMEQCSEPGKVNISSSTYLLVKDQFQFQHRGKTEIKNKPEMDTYFVQHKE